MLHTRYSNYRKLIEIYMKLIAVTPGTEIEITLYEIDIKSDGRVMLLLRC